MTGGECHQEVCPEPRLEVWLLHRSRPTASGAERTDSPEARLTGTQCRNEAYSHWPEPPGLWQRFAKHVPRGGERHQLTVRRGDVTRQQHNVGSLQRRRPLRGAP